MLVNGFLREDLSVKSGLEGVVAIDLFNAAADARYNKIIREVSGAQCRVSQQRIDGIEYGFPPIRCLCLDSKERKTRNTVADNVCS